jgi:hypothetical protein
VTADTLRTELRELNLLPHQVDFVERSLDLTPPGRVLLTDGVGMGKGFACAALIWAWQQKHGRRPRSLVVSPRILGSQWVQRLGALGFPDCTEMDAAEFRRLEAHTPAGVNPWTQAFCAVTSIDFLKRSDRMSELLQLSWDVVVFEEAHLATEKTQRGQVLQRLWTSNQVGLMIALTATPPQDLTASLSHTSGLLTFRRRAKEIVDWSGAPIFDLERSIELLEVALTLEEKAVLEAVIQLLTDGHESLRRIRHPFSLAVAKVASSSIFALEELFQRSLTLASVRAPESEQRSVLERDQDDAVENAVDTDEIVVASIDLPEAITTEQLAEVLQRIEDVPRDSKFQACLAALERAFATGEQTGVVLTEFHSTGFYVANLLRDNGVTSWLVTGASPLDERVASLTQLRTQGGVGVFTSPTLGGLNLAFCKFCVHYDLPGTTASMARRLARFERFGAPPGPVRHVFFTDMLTLPSDVETILSGVSEG